MVFIEEAKKFSVCHLFHSANLPSFQTSVLSGERDTTLAAQRFCEVANRLKKARGERWDAAVLVIDK